MGSIPTFPAENLAKRYTIEVTATKTVKPCRQNGLPAKKQGACASGSSTAAAAKKKSKKKKPRTVQQHKKK
jgi:hypothetical protein